MNLTYDEIMVATDPQRAIRAIRGGSKMAIAWEYFVGPVELVSGDVVRVVTLGTSYT